MEKNNKYIRFVEHFKVYICISLAIIILGLIFNFIFGTKLDINFSGGTKISYSYTGEIDTDKVKQTVEKNIENKVDVALSEDYTTHTKSLVISVVGNQSLSTEELGKIETALQTDYKDNSLNVLSKNAVDKTVGASFFGKSLYALAIASILVVIYVGIRFRKIGGVMAALTALFALVHDVAIVYFSDVIFGITLDANFIAVVLTILGYSLNDTIVIYDRIREAKADFGETMTDREIVNFAITKSLRRSLVTSITTFVAISCVTVVAMFAGLDTILSFSIPMSIGTIAGSFSSICLAGPLYVFWLEFKAKHINSKPAKKNSKKVPDYVNRKK